MATHTSAPSRKSRTASPEPASSGAERPGNNSRTRRMRLRAAWMYFVEEMTQNDIATQLGVGRVTVVRLLSEARERNEVKFSIQGGMEDCIELARSLEKRFGLDEAIVVPVSSPQADATIPIAAAAGMYVSELVQPGTRIGVGWGRTLWESLSYMDESMVPDVSVVSMLGGITKVKHFNPSEFAWRFSNLFQADCYLMTAPAIVDSAATRKALIEKCGLGEVFERARDLDVVLVSVGDMDDQGTAYRYGFVPESLRSSMVEHGAVGEILFNYFDAEGKVIKHPINQCVMSVPLSTLADARQRIIASGGASKAAALLGALRLVRPTVLITDEHAARRALELDRASL
jgi:DNA-binding transcriptional regulator LsrR (DeoR family)